MKRLILSALFVLVIFAVRAQTAKSDPADSDKIDIKEPIDSSKNIDHGPVFTAVEIDPSFKGGMDNFYRFLSANIRYPVNAVKNRTQGKVFITFIVEADGSLNDIKVIRGLSDDINTEAIRVLKTSPRWSPGIQNGRPVRVQFVVPITFKLPAQLPAVDSIAADTNKTFKAVDIDPSFPGGIEKFYNYLLHNKRYPKEARKKNIRGRVRISFVVEKDGSLTNITITQSVSPETDAEATRLIKESPKWSPGMQGGHPVRVRYSVPIEF